MNMKCWPWKHKWQTQIKTRDIGLCLETVETDPRGIPVFYEKCTICLKDRPFVGIVIPSAEASMPWFNCKCGKGNAAHQEDRMRAVRSAAEALRSGNVKHQGKSNWTEGN